MREPVFPCAIELPEAAGGRLTALHRQLRGAIVSGRLPAGFALPATRVAAMSLGVARNTVAKAYDLLVAEGYVRARRGARATVQDLGLRPGASGPGDPQPQRLLNPQWLQAADSFEPVGSPALPNFRIGIADHGPFPHALWRQLSQRSLRQLAREPFRYPPSAGLPELRQAIAQHVAFARAVRCTPDDVVVTSGAQQAFDLLARVLVVPGQTAVAVEEPGYPPLRDALRAAGAKLIPVGVDDDGLRVADIPAEVRVVCVTPSHHSPTGVMLSQARRLQLLAQAAERDLVILEDDYDGEFHFGGRPLDALKTLDRSGRVAYVGTFSKSLFPALRKGFVVAPAWLRPALLAAKHCADAHCDAVGQRVLSSFIQEGHLVRHVRRMHRHYAPRRAALVAGLDALSPWLQRIPGDAGLHLGAQIRPEVDATRLLAAARRHLPGVVSWAEYAVDPATCAPGITLGFGLIDTESIEQRLRDFADQLRREAAIKLPNG